MNEANPAILRALDAADKTFGDEPLNCHADRTGRQIDLGANHVDWQRPLVKQYLEDPEIRVAQAGFPEVCDGISRDGPHRLHHHEPCVHGCRSVFLHGRFPNQDLMIAEFISIDIKIMDINVLEGHRLVDDVTCYPTIRN